MIEENTISNPISGTTISVYKNADSRYILFEGYAMCKILGYANPARTIEQLVSPKYIRRVRTILGKNKLPKILLTEPGVYQLAMKSRASHAAEFQDWVFEEVLPSIHKNGGYVMGQEKLPENERNALTSQIKQLSDIVKIQGDKLKELESFAKTQNTAYNKLKDRVFDLANDLQNGPTENNLFKTGD